MLQIFPNIQVGVTNIPTYIPNDFKPTEDTITALKADGIVLPFLDRYVTQHFTEFWNELKTDKKKKGLKSAWQTCYRIWARRAFHGKLGREYEETRHGPRRFGKSKPHIFQEVQADLMNTPKMPKPKPATLGLTHNKILMPKCKPMSRKKALAELGKLSKRLGGKS